MFVFVLLFLSLVVNLNRKSFPIAPQKSRKTEKNELAARKQHKVQWPCIEIRSKISLNSELTQVSHNFGWKNGLIIHLFVGFSVHPSRRKKVFFCLTIYSLGFFSLFSFLFHFFLSWFKLGMNLKMIRMIEASKFLIISLRALSIKCVAEGDWCL